MWHLEIIKATPKCGNELLTVHGSSIGYSLLDFWQWSVSDLMSNATRWRFAEFIVWSAIGMNPKNLREEWAPFDLLSEDWIKIEIKSAAYIQSWKQKDYSKISFSIKPARFWDATTGNSDKEAKRHADIYVFCLLHNKDEETIDPLKLEQWSFFVLPTFCLDNYTRSRSSITLKSLEKLTKAIPYKELKDAIKNSHGEQMQHRKR